MLNGYARRLLVAGAFVGALMTFPASGASAQAVALQNGTTLLDQNKLPEARAQLMPYAKSNPKDARGAFQVGRLLILEGESFLSQNKEKDAIGRYEEAADWIEKAIKLDGKNGTYHRWLGDSYGRQAQRSTNKLKQAMLAKKVKNEYEESVRLDPKDLSARESLIEFYMQAPGFMGGGVDKAEAQAREIAKIDRLRGHYNLAKVYIRQKKMDLALGELKAAEKENPDSIGAGLRVGYLYVTEKKFDDAFAQFDRLAQRYPSDPVVTFQIGRTAAISGQQLERGEAALKSYLAGPAPKPDQPAFASAHFRLGNIYEKRGATSSARTSYTEALRLNPQLKDARTALEKLK